jgi:hypothetical protein
MKRMSFYPGAGFFVVALAALSARTLKDRRVADNGHSALRRSYLTWSSGTTRSLAASCSRVNVAVELLPAVRIL